MMDNSKSNNHNSHENPKPRATRISWSLHATTMKTFELFLLFVVVVAFATDTADRKLQGNTLLESVECIERSVVKAVYNDRNDDRLMPGSPSVTPACFNQYDYCGSTLSPTACCRISFELGWAVCDSANGFYSSGMACICNENSGKTPSPTVSPQPTAPPVMPTPPPVRPPTQPPTEAPVVAPTEAPVAPTDAPVAPTPAPVAPTEAPVAPTEAPVAPTEAPVAPTDAPIAPTEAPVAPTEAPVAPTEAPVTPTDAPIAPTDAPIAPLPDPTEAPVVPVPTDAPTVQSDGPDGSWVTENRVDGDFVRQTRCVEAPPPPTAVVRGSSTFSYAYRVVADPDGVDDPRTSGRFFTMLTDRMHDSLARAFVTCDYGSQALWMLQSGLHDVLNEEECPGGSVQNGGDCLVLQATHRVSVVDSSPEAEGRGSVGGDYRQRKLQELSDQFAGAMIEFVDEGMANGDFNIDGLTLDMSFDQGEIIVITVAPTDSPVDASTDAPLPVDLATPSPSVAPVTGGGVNNIQEGNNNNAPPSSGNSGLSPPFIATVVVASAFVVLVALMLVSRRRRRDRQQDDEYLQKGNVSTMEIDHLEIDSASPGNESMIRVIKTPGSGDPIVLTSFSMDEDYEDPFTSTSPSKRSKRGPLTSQDELDRSFDSEENPIVASFRGGPATTPRNYPVQDTVNL